MTPLKTPPPRIPSRVPAINDIPIRYDPHLSQDLSEDDSERTSTFETIRSVGRTLTALAVFIVVIIIIVNFLILFPAIAIVSPELIDLHHAEMETKIPFKLDLTKPVITEITLKTTNTTYTLIDLFSLGALELHQGEIFKLEAMAVDDHLDKISAELLGEKYILKYKLMEKNYQILLPTPITLGDYDVTLTATDIAGNSATFPIPIRVIATTKPVVSFEKYSTHLVVNRNTDLDFEVYHPYPTQLRYIHTDPQLTITTSALASPYTIPTNSWLEGMHDLEIIANDIYGNTSSYNYTITIDDSAPKISSLDLTPLTVNRKKLFGLELPENNYHRGEIVMISSGVFDPNLVQVSIQIRPQEDAGGPVTLRNELNLNPGSSNFELIVSLPTNAGKYTLELTACDMANNIRTYQPLNFTVAKITYEGVLVPILTLRTPLNASSVSQAAIFRFGVNNGKLDGLQYTFNNTDTKLEPSFKFNVTNLDEGNHKLTVHARRTNNIYDAIFITLPLPPFIFALFFIEGIPLLIYYCFISAALILSALWLIAKNGKNYITSISKYIFSLKPPPLKTDNTLVLIAQLFLAILFLNVLYSIILSLFEITPHIPAFGEQPLWMLLYNLATASAWEEIISRTLLIGVPLLFFDTLVDTKSKPTWKYLLGGGFELNFRAVILIIFSALVFGLAHAPGWDYWKVITSSASGLAFGYLFVRKGLHASMMLHLTINYLTMPLRVVGDPIALVMLFDIALVLLIAVGFILFVYYIIRIFRFIGKATKSSEAT